MADQAAFLRIPGFCPCMLWQIKLTVATSAHKPYGKGQISEGETYRYAHEKYGHQFICEGSEVQGIPKNNYDFLLSCNNLEHMANPLKAVKNWVEILNDNGIMVLVLPRKELNFDHKRTVTTFEHLLDDYKCNVGEDDLTHVEEILKEHDLKLDPPAGALEDFKKRSLDNYSNRCLHHHVYDLQLLEQICKHFKLRVLTKTSLTADHVIIAQKGMTR